MTALSHRAASEAAVAHSRAERMREIAIRAAVALEGASAEEILRWGVDTFGSRIALTSSMTDAVVADLASRVAPGVDVLFLDTGYHFAETIGTRDAVEATYRRTLNLITVTPEHTVEEQDAAHGPRLYERDPDLCCALRKVAPLERALRDYDAWITGLRRDDSPQRADTPVVGYDERRAKVKVNPIAAWTQADVDAYIQERGILVNPLLMDGYTSVGCAPCTARAENGRSGRWVGTSKTECGLHT